MKTRTVIIALALVGAFAYGSYMTFQIDTGGDNDANNVSYDVTTLPNATGVSYANESRVISISDNGYTFFTQLQGGFFGSSASDLRYKVNLSEPVPYRDRTTNQFVVDMIPRNVNGNASMLFSFTAVGTGSNANASFDQQMVSGATAAERRQNITDLSEKLNDQTPFDQRVPYEEMMLALTEYPYGQSIPALNSTDSWERTVDGQTITFEVAESRTYPENPIYSATNITMSADGERLGTFAYSELKDLPQYIEYTDAADMAVESVTFQRATGSAECSVPNDLSPNCESG